VGAGGREGREGSEGSEFSLLTAWCKELFFSRVVLDLRRRNLLPEGRRVKRQLEGLVGAECSAGEAGVINVQE